MASLGDVYKTGASGFPMKQDSVAQDRLRTRSEEILVKKFSDLCELCGREKNRRPPFDQAQDERLSTRMTDYSTPFVLRFSKHERIFSHDLCLCGEYFFTENPEQP